MSKQNKEESNEKEIPNNCDLNKFEDNLLIQAKLLYENREHNLDWSDDAKAMLKCLEQVWETQKKEIIMVDGEKVCYKCQRSGVKVKRWNRCEGCRTRIRDWKRKLKVEQHKECKTCNEQTWTALDGNCRSCYSKIYERVNRQRYPKNKIGTKKSHKSKNFKTIPISNLATDIYQQENLYSLLGVNSLASTSSNFGTLPGPSNLIQNGSNLYGIKCRDCNDVLGLENYCQADSTRCGPCFVKRRNEEFKIICSGCHEFRRLFQEGKCHDCFENQRVYEGLFGEGSYNASNIASQMLTKNRLPISTSNQLLPTSTLLPPINSSLKNPRFEEEVCFVLSSEDEI